ncbi:hypothetical protein GF339_08635 [candidate division KSB3 bacterium]|uniref:HTH HARE-type domain-containing protein n=1 Tax=candidate division KSB3 bacterium TaxID=2044937 RepID=A0A9D5JVE2_9BACT|nr:hypothetical protein [candidate division KSB3 bacterium]MBD3324636.1 hypothetical protein [candidate division KSB3 bacterium]
MNNIYEIEIQYIKELIPNRLYNRLVELGVCTVAQICDIDPDEFLTYQRVGENTATLLKNLRKIITKNPEKLLTTYRKNCFGPVSSYIIDTKTQDIELRFIKEIIPNRLYNRFVELGITRISQIYDINSEDFCKCRGVGPDTVNSLEYLRRRIAENPEQIVTIYHSNCPVMLPHTIRNVEDLSFFEGFKAIITDYFKLKGSTFERDVIFKRYGINEKKSYRLDEIGLYYDRTRERIRQIQDDTQKKLKRLIETGKDKRLNVQLSPICQSKIKGFLATSQKFKIISQKTFLSTISEKYHVKIEACDIAYLNLLLETYKFHAIKFNRSTYYVFEQVYRSKTVTNIFQEITLLLKENVLPLSEFDIVVSLKKRFKKQKIQNELIILALNALEIVEKISMDGQPLYKLQFHQFSSSIDQAFIVLHETHDSLHYNEICKEINSRLKALGSSKRISPEFITPRLASDSRFTPEGRSGKWLLADWGENTGTIKELIVEAIRTYNRPCTMKEIILMVKQQRPDVREKSIYAIIRMNEKIFLKLKNRMYVLREWESLYKDSLVKEASPKLDLSNFDHYLVDIFKSHNTEELSTTEIYNHLVDFGINLAGSTIYTKLKNTRIVNKRKSGKMAYYSLKEGYETLMTTRDSNPKTSKTNLIVNSAKEYLQKYDGVLLLRKLVKLVSTECNVPKATVYKIVAESEDLQKFENSEGKKTVKLQEAPSKPLQPLERNDHNPEIDRIIAEGEGIHIEFKSSLRWDYRQQAANKDLEFEIVKATSAFLNTNGGRLFIGIDDDGNILGLSSDYKTIGKKNKDGFQLQLINVLTKYLTKDYFKFVKISVIDYQGEEICMLQVSKSDVPAFVKKDGKDKFFIRVAASSQSLSVQETVNYIRNHWEN